MAHLVDSVSAEGLEPLHNSLNQADLKTHPFLSTVLQDVIIGVINIQHGSRRTVDSTSEAADVPIEVQKRREAEAAGKPFRVPEWWRGEDANYKVAQVMMKTVPKDIGPITT